MKPKVSVIIPCYKVEKYIDRCLKSIINQTLKELEIIVVDDKSPDSTPQLCDEWAAKDSRIKVIHKEKNEGLGFARNTGLDLATGEFVAFVDSDDFVDVNMYQILYDKAKESDADTVYCNSVIYTSESQQKKRNEVDKEVIFEGRSQVNSFLLDIVGPEPENPHYVKYMMSVWHAIYNRKLIDQFKIRFVSEREFVSEDIFFDVDFLSQANKIAFLPDHFYYYCVNSASLSHTYSIEKYGKVKNFLSSLRLKLDTYYLKDFYYIRYLRLMFNHCFSSLRYSYSKTLQISMNDVLNDVFWEPVLKNYPYHRMSFRLRVIFCCMKFRTLHWGLRVIFYVMNKQS